jgi:peptidoglycan/LPS O-acetylase OafA/YrhL
VALDGVAAKQLADEWASAPAATQSVALAMVSTNETINFGLAGLFNMTFAGVPYVLFGLAVAFADTYPRWLGWVAVAAGLGSIGAAMVQMFTGEPTMASLVLTIIGPTVIAAGTFAMGILLGRWEDRAATISGQAELIAALVAVVLHTYLPRGTSAKRLPSVSLNSDHQPNDY